MKTTLLLLLIFLNAFYSHAQNPPLQQNKLPEGTKLTIKKDTTPVRFAVSFRETTRGAGTHETQLNKIYNLNSSEISLGQSSITVNKTGLYHFDYYIQAIANSSDKRPVFTTFLSGVFPQSSITFTKDEEMKPAQEGGLYRGNWHFSVDVHISAPATLKLMRYIIGGTGTTSAEGKLLGHLISE